MWLTIMSVGFDILSQNYYICLNKMTRMRKLAIIFALIFCVNLSAQPLSPQQMQSLPLHPRLILREGDVQRVHLALQNEPGVERLWDYLLRRVERIMDAPVCRREKTGKRLLSVSREVLERVWNCSLAYLLTGDAEYAARAEAEMLAASAFEDWNPSHFLDVGEMTAALALGYDWLYDWLPEQSRHVIEQAIINKGLLGAEKESQMWFYKRANNWNQVCNGGFVMGALAIADREPELAAKIVEKSLSSIVLGLKPYAPAGVYPEGYSYWSYGTWYQVLMIEALRTALGDSRGLEKSAGFLQSADFMNYMVAPSGRVFNFSDCGNSRPVQNLLLAWFADECRNMSLIYRETESLKQDDLRIMERRFLSVAILFLARCDMSSVAPPQRNFWYADGKQPLFVYRGGWDSSDDVYLAAKGGSSSISHAHMDAGSFIYEWGGVRWSCDLGSQNYYSLESRGVKLWGMTQESQRWDVFRINNLSHSTLSVDDAKHLCAGKAKMVEVYDSPMRYGATFDMSSVLDGLSRAERTITIDGQGCVTVEDDVTAERACSLRWVMCTPAEATIVNRRTILLQSGGRRLRIEAVAPRGVEPFILSNDPPHDYDAPNKGTCRVGFVVKLRAVRSAVLKIMLTPEV